MSRKLIGALASSRHAVARPERTLLFFGSLSNLEHTIRARYTVTGIERRCDKRTGRFCGTIDDFRTR